MEDNSKSYYATIEDNYGNQKTIWGKEIKNAVDASGAAKNDNVTLQHGGKEDVTVTAKNFDEQGKVTGTRKIDTHRNNWVMTKK